MLLIIDGFLMNNFSFLISDAKITKTFFFIYLLVNLIKNKI